jgi:hypothetical protein
MWENVNFEVNFAFGASSTSDRISRRCAMPWRNHRGSKILAELTSAWDGGAGLGQVSVQVPM